ncbi:hypothetical protein CGZ90_12750 [Fictibacillus aquaticus]|uniref:HTH marR-type domain-containing protein n=2 Tax=Fictibacillus aquaticus TaxID=2021314 RepID=A0A235F9M8_9BACL|nr:hypothetical protein CGZ90_12750 [Fictibacillus aquaticus]
MGNAAYIKEKNKRHILQCIKEHGPIARSRISETLHLSKPTVSALVEELLHEGWVREEGNGDAGQLGGRKPIYLTFNSRAAYIFGVDIGGTKTLTAVSDLAGNILGTREFPTQDNLQYGLLKKVQKHVQELLLEQQISEDRVLGIGIGAPGTTDIVQGTVIDAPSLNWHDYPLQNEASALFPFPVFIDNDVNVAVLGEQWLGSAKNMSNVVLISIGTGIGCGIMINGQLYRGASFAAGEIGYLVTDKNEAKKHTKRAFEGYGFLDSFTGGPAIVAKMQEALGDKAIQELTAKDVFDLAKSGDQTALAVTEEVVDHIGFAIANVISIINPEAVILGGGISKSSPWYLPRIEQIVSEFAAVKTVIKTTTCGPNLGVIGAVSLVLREHESALKTF